MRAVLMTAVGGPEVLQLTELPEPELAREHDARVRVRAAGINPVDYKLRSYGTFARSLPVILGCDGAGVVEATGPAVTRVRPGDEVYFCDGGFGPVPGTYQEVKGVHERYLARKPERLSFAAAAAAPLVTITAWEALRERARVEEGQFVLVQGGADVVHDTVGGATFTASFQLVRPYGDLVSNVESPWEDEAVTATHSRNLRVSFTWMPALQVFGWPGTGSGSGRSSSRRLATSTPASCASWSVPRSRWSGPRTRTARSRPGR